MRPMTPATATSVRTYGSAVKSVEIDVEYACRLTPSALEKPNSRHAAAAPNGRQPPKMSAASAMNPRPPVMFSVNALPSPIERYAPPAPARMPDTIDCAVAHRVDVDADGVRGARMLAAGADAQADRRLEDDDPREEHDRIPIQIIG